ncbi:MAG TPA: ASCH domain-containing protein [Caulobacteraceae bacterium]|jgi:hypothetical protein
MTFTKRLHPGIIAGEITCSVRIWHKPRVKVGGRYQIEDGEVEVTGVREIGWDDITPALARRSGFEGVVDLLKIARHGAGEHVFLVDFEYHGPEGSS